MVKRKACCEKKGLKRGQWTAEEDEILINYISENGYTSWRSLPQLAGLNRCGKSCRLRWTNYLRPDIKRGPFKPDEEKLVIQLHAVLGNRWAAIASHFPGRTDNEIKNLWNTHLRRRLISMGIDPNTHEPLSTNKVLPPSPSTRHMAQWESARMEAEARLSKESLLHNSFNSQSSSTESDYFLRIWNSEIGESFRKVKRAVCESPASSCTTKLANQMEYECKPVIDHQREEDSSESALQLLFDFPYGCNEMNFFEDNIGGGY
ncbi:uncharacterized protein [Phyllobates terribilis]|uniref:uncharacterized protein n=1 Tax=Phyllobates terribilis TaxID=111132 RepID=UPI003CCADD93